MHGLDAVKLVNEETNEYGRAPCLIYSKHYLTGTRRYKHHLSFIYEFPDIVTSTNDDNSFFIILIST